MDLLGIFDHIASGVVTGKKHYGYAKPRTAPLTKQNAVFYEGTAEMAECPVPSESWSLTVKGVDKHGKALIKEIYVEPLAWNATKVGDSWPIISTR